MSEYFTIERVCSLVGSHGSGRFRLVYRRDYIPELRTHRDFLIAQELIEDLRPWIVRIHEDRQKELQENQALLRGRPQIAR